MEFLFSHTSSYTPQCSDLEQRLKVLQIDYAALQASHDKLEEEKVMGGKEVQAIREELEMLRDKLKKAEEEITNLHKDKESVSEELKQLKLSLEHQLANQKLLIKVSWYCIIMSDISISILHNIYRNLKLSITVLKSHQNLQLRLLQALQSRRRILKQHLVKH